MKILFLTIGRFDSIYSHGIYPDLLRCFMNQGEPVLIEANIKTGSIWMSEMSYDCGPFGKKTLEILSWLRLMNKTKVSD